MEKVVKKRKLVLQNGAEFVGTGFGADTDALCELVFNTSMVGYQEIVTDPGYADQMVLMTYPLIGNYGINDEDSETRVPTLSGMVVREYCDEPSNFRYTKTLSELLEESNVPGLSEVDTRAITRILRDEGSMIALICDADVPSEEALARIRAYVAPRDSVRRVSCKKKSYARTPNPRYSVVAIDCGIKQSLIKALNSVGCNVTVVPYNTSAEEILSCKADGLYISDGPGNPSDVPEVIETIAALRGKLPMFGVCLGHELMALACGAKTVRLKCGRYGANQPVRCVETGKLEIPRQNRSFVVHEASLEGTGLTITHRSVLDNAIEGLSCMEDRMFSLQFTPADDKPYKQFVKMMEEGKRHA
ncbi:MAG: glutamine-hydrolyzing carbamoyl-phosphate synthase small subunit [Clostridia bacterium]|nr:glutamine-hydrolyzing carbamoyl-phosphate synthase small subunit [Clostridia bacterium]